MENKDQVQDPQQDQNQNPEAKSETPQPVQAETKKESGSTEDQIPETEPEEKEALKVEEKSEEVKAEKDIAEEKVLSAEVNKQPEKVDETAVEDSKPVPEKNDEPVKEKVKEEVKAEVKETEEEKEEEKPVSLVDSVTESVFKGDEAHADEGIVAEDEESEEEGDEEEEEEDEESIRQEYEKLTREELLKVFEELVNEENINKIKTRVGLLKVIYREKTKLEQEELKQKEEKAEVEKPEENKDSEVVEGKAESEKEESVPQLDPLEERFQKAFGQYKKNRAKFLEQQEKIKEANLQAKKDILEDLRQLIQSEETLKKTYDDFKELQDKWKQIGPIPRAEVNELWANYHFLVEKFFDKVKINKELKDLDLKKNLEKKIDLCEQAEELLLETSIIKSFRQLQKLHQEWKEIGPVPHDKNEEIWERFRAATEKINERRKEYYDRLQEQQGKNLMAKNALIEQAQTLLEGEIKSTKDWQERTEKAQELMKVWKTIGPAPKKDNDEIWERFRGFLNSFYDQKKEFFGSLKSQQLENYNLKLDICAQAEAIQDSTEWKKTTMELINLQKEWKKIGPVPRKYSDKIWKRFRAACDNFFNKKSEYFSNIHEHEAANSDKKKTLIEKVKTHEFGDEKAKNMEELKGFQREWMDIGHVPVKEKDKLNASFREAINKRLDELKISAREIETLQYRSRVEQMRKGGGSNKAMGKEKGYLQGKITGLRNDINTWENNLGFLANSKNADILKEEFEKKIQKAKEELALLEAKLKMLS